MYSMQNNTRRHAEAVLLAGVFGGGLGKYLTHEGGQSVPSHLHHKVVALTAVGRRCTEAAGSLDVAALPSRGCMNNALLPKALNSRSVLSSD